MRHLIWILLVLCLPVGAKDFPGPKSISQLQEQMTQGSLSAEALTRFYLARIHSLDQGGPHLNAVIAVNPDALAQARALDRERRQHGPRGPLHGIPVLIKDNIETLDKMPTTAGSLALERNFATQDAPVVAALRAAGAVILGKTNLSEWANFRSSHSSSGWSAMGGLVRNPFVLDRTACGSSSGSGVAVAADLAPASLGTETDGSVTCPSSMNGIVGIKPTLGLLSQRGIVPIAHSQDTAGPMARSVTDVALLLTAMVAHKAQCEPAASECHEANYVAALNKDGLQGKRIGVLRFAQGSHPEMDVVYERALSRLRTAGATLIEVKAPESAPIEAAELKVLLSEFKADLNAYLGHLAPAVPVRNLAQLIEFNRSSPYELELFGQELFDQAEKTTGLEDPAYRSALEQSKRLAGKEGIDQLLQKEKLDFLVAPTTSSAWRVDLVQGDRNGDSYTTLPAVAGYPHLTVPMGQVQGLPVGISFIGTAWSEPQLLAAGYAFGERSPPFQAPKLLRSVEDSLLAADRDDAKGPKP
jgi:amidase